VAPRRGAALAPGRVTGAAIAARLRAGAVSVNSVLGFAAVPALPFGGSQDSGFGRIHGEEGLRAFTSVQSTTVQRFSPPVALTSFRLTEEARQKAVRMARSLHRRR
jgi:acyl-CoA reductase-like NAD-dependent aldehyde dehydrogenase